MRACARAYVCAVRVRPLNAREKAGEAECAWKIKKNNIASIGGDRDVNLHFGEPMRPRVLVSVFSECIRTHTRAHTRTRALALNFDRQLVRHQVNHAGGVRHDGERRGNFGDGGHPWSDPTPLCLPLCIVTPHTNVRHCHGQARCSPTARPAVARHTQ